MGQGYRVDTAVFIITPDQRDAYNVMVTSYVRQLYPALVLTPTVMTSPRSAPI